MFLVCETKTRIIEKVYILLFIEARKRRMINQKRKTSTTTVSETFNKNQ